MAFRGRVSAVLVVALAAASMLSLGVARAATCPPPPTAVKPFVPWSDGNQYVLTTGASFENGMAGWALAGGATVVDDNAPNPLDAQTDSHALYLPAGSSATSACVTAPQILGIVRFFAKDVGLAGGQLKVDILVKGGVYHAGTITPGSTWSPTPILASNAPAYKGAVTYQIRLSAIGTGSAFTIDDIYFDPFKAT